MKERPIIMTAESVRAILDGRKTQTRRVINERVFIEMAKGDEPPILQDNPDFAKVYLEFGKYPYGVTGDRLWVKEAFAEVFGGPPFGLCFYRANGETIAVETPSGPSREFPRWKSPLFMKRTSSRITLEITNIKVEQLQDITEEDAIKEGYDRRDAYAWAWNSINAKRGYPWESNPWVWVIEFKRAKEQS